MNITTILKAAVRQAVAEVQDTRAVILDARHMLNHEAHSLDECAAVLDSYSALPTVVEWVASQTLLRGVTALSVFLYKDDEDPEWLAEYEAYMAEDHGSMSEGEHTISVDEAMAALRKWFTAIEDDK